MFRTTLPALSIILTAFVLLYGAGYCYAIAELWGIHEFGFIPSSVFVLYVVFALGGFLYCWKGDIEKPLRASTRLMEHKPGLFITLCCALFIIIAFVFRIHVPLLGDAYTLTNNFENTLNGEHKLSFGNEPISISFLYTTIVLLAARSFSDIMSAIFLAELVLGCGFILLVYRTAQLLFPEKGDSRKVLTFLYLLILPYTQLFFGYAESYAVVLFFLSCTMLVTLLSLKGKIPFWVTAFFFALQFFAHYLGALLCPMIVYLAYQEYKQRGARHLLMTIPSAMFVVLLTMTIAGFEFHRLVPDDTHSHLLSFRESSDQYDAYTLFSLAHAIDLLNLLLFMALGSIILLMFGRPNLRSIMREPLEFSLLLVIIPLMLFLLVARFDLGMAKDWDVIAPYFYVVALLTIMHILRKNELVRFRIMSMVILMTSLSSGVYFLLNATPNAGIQRIKTLMSNRLMPQSGVYQSSFHLSTAYFDEEKIDSMIVLWQRYTYRFPDDLRGYEKLAELYWKIREPGYDSLYLTYDRCLRVDTTNVKVRKEYADFCVFLGAVRQKQGQKATARDLYVKALSLSPTLASAYSNIGLLFESESRTDSARLYYKKAIHVDSAYAVGYKNMGNLYLMEEAVDSAIYYFQKAIQFNPRLINAYEQLAAAYDVSGKTETAIPAFQKAARLGSAKAQQYLTQHGHTW